MTLFEYILKSMPRVNWAVAKNWLDDWAPEEYAKLYNYVEETPWNTNSNFLKEMVGAGDYIVLLDGTYEFVSQTEDFAIYNVEDSKYYNPVNVTVTFDGETYILPKVGEGMYGEVSEELPVFTIYPVAVSFASIKDDQGEFVKLISIATSTAGRHIVKITIPSGSEIDGGGDASEGAIVGEAIVGEAIINNGGRK